MLSVLIAHTTHITEDTHSPRSYTTPFAALSNPLTSAISISDFPYPRLSTIATYFSLLALLFLPPKPQFMHVSIHWSLLSPHFIS